MLRYKLKKVDGILVIGEEVKKYYEKYSSKVINLPYSIKKNINFSRKKYNISFLFIGQLIERKGTKILGDSISKINDINS